MTSAPRALRGVALTIALAACSFKSSPESAAYFPEPPPPPGAAAAPSAPMGGGGGAKGAKDGYAKAAAEELDPAEPRPTDAAPTRRMVHYDGSVRVRVPDPRKTLDTVAQLAAELGGYVEQQNDTMVMIRVPVAHVREAFNKLLLMGDVLSRSLTAADVTDAFTASELRLKTMRASRDRLIALLASVKEEQERLQILAEIRRLTEIIDSLNLQVQTLAKLAAYSRLTLQTETREQRGVARNNGLAAFRWVDALSPFSRDEASRGRLLKLATPKEMVVLDDSRHWVAESADGAVVWTSKRKNAPHGDSAFWANAIEERVAEDFAEHKRQTIGGYEVLSFVDGGTTHYRYRVAVRADGDDLDVIEVYYPTPEHEARYAPAVDAVIAGGAS